MRPRIRAHLTNVESLCARDDPMSMRHCSVIRTQRPRRASGHSPEFCSRLVISFRPTCFPGRGVTYFPRAPDMCRAEVAQMRIFSLRCLLLAVPMASVFAQTPALQMNIVYVCTDGQSFKVFSCDNTTGACNYQNYKKGQAYQRGEALRVQLAALLPAKCHAQTPAEAQADPHRGEIPPAPSPFQARASAGSNGSGSAVAVNPQTGPGVGGFKVGDTVRVLSDGWQE